MEKDKNHSRVLGKWGEEIARNYLIEKNYQIIQKNVYSPYSEIDLVAYSHGKAVFVEVKTVLMQRGESVESAIRRAGENINFKKVQRLVRGINSFVQESGIVGPWSLVICLICADKLGDSYVVEHIELIDYY